MPRKPRGPHRLFVAAYPPVEAALAMLGAIEFLSLPPHRATRSEQVHLTLAFLGDTCDRDLPRIVESIDRAAAGIPVLRLTPRRLVSLPRSGPARLVALETDCPPELSEIVSRLVRRLVRRPRNEAPDRFLPHLTLCRIDAQAPGSASVDEPASLPSFPLIAIHLMASVLRPHGAEHSPVRTFPLGVDQ